METKLSHKMLAGAVAATLAAPASADIILSQYVEGASYDKAIEIANTGSSTLSLDGYALVKASNGGSWGTPLPLDGYSLEAGKVLVVANTRASSEILNLSQIQEASVSNFNGNDPIALFKDGKLHDVLGYMNSSYWGSDKTLIRNSDALTPTTVFNESDWSALSKGDFTGLGEFNTAEPPQAFTCTDNGNQPHFTTIQQIQGEGSTSPYISGYPFITDQTFFVKGVVSAVTTSLTKGFYLQASEDDYNPLTSEGLFVETGQTSSDLKPGDQVCVEGKVQEFYGRTQLKAENNQWLVTGTQAAPTASEMQVLETDADFDQTLERYEGMLVKTTQQLDMRVTRTFSYDYAARRNNMVLAQGRINMQPNQLFVAGSELAKAQSEQNAQRRLYVESDQSAQAGQVPYYPDFGRTDIDQNGSTEDYIRIDDTVVGLEGVVSFSYGDYRLIATNSLTSDNFVRNDPRTEKPKLKKGGDLRIATFNVLNYFNSPFGGDANPQNKNRGASNFAEFEVQQAKILSAILRLDADIIGLMEIENNGYGDGSAIRQLVDNLNARIENTKDHYTFVAIDANQDGLTDKQDFIGTDVITTGVIYRDKVVQLRTSRVIPMPQQVAPPVLDSSGKEIEDGKNYQRDALAPTFKVRGTREKITVAVNHLKSKGSKCWEDAAPVEQGGQNMKDPDKQGSCEHFRVAAAVALGEALKEIKGHKVILGDLNAYGQEDPMLVLTDYSKEKHGKTIKAARNTLVGGEVQFGDEGAVIEQNYGFINAVEMMHPNSWSYSYNDEVGALDHLLISPSLEAYIVDATDWHINGGESPLLDYNTERTGDLPKYQDHYRSSDHDPAILELNMGGSLGLAGLMALLGFGAWRRRQ